MAREIDWLSALDLGQAVANLRLEMPGDWHQDPWGWPELGYMLKKDPALVQRRCEARGVHAPALLDVPKENWGTRPAVVIDIADRLAYQALTDHLSLDLQAGISPNTYGWRLPAVAPQRGRYSHNNKQWDGYRRHLSVLASWHSVALRTDLVSFFASIPVAGVQAAVQDRCANSAITRRLCDMLDGFNAVPGRSGLPQRSTASSVIANMYLAPLDDVLTHHSKPLPVRKGRKVRYHSFARWMDDIWLFGGDPARSRRAQMDLQSASQDLGLNLNYSKTDVLEGEEVAKQALEIEHSAVDDAIDLMDDFEPLESLIDDLLDAKEKASRTSVKFAVKRMRDHDVDYRIQELILAAPRMPHVADAFSRLFKTAYSRSTLQDWYLDYIASDWATHEWSVAWLGRMFPSSMKPRKKLREFFAGTVRDANTNISLLAVASQRLAAWDEVEARTAFRDAYNRSPSPHTRRILALAAIGVGETRSKVREWLAADPENEPTLGMLETYGFPGPKIQADFAG